MRRHLKATVRLLFVAWFIFHLSPPCYSQTRGGDEATFIKLQSDWAEARKNRDVAFLEKFYTKEFTVGSIDGSESSREQDLSMFSSGDMRPAVITDSEIKVLRYGDSALVTGVEHLEGSYKGQAGNFDLRFANFFIYRDKRWQIVRHQATLIAARTPRTATQ